MTFKRRTPLSNANNALPCNKPNDWLKKYFNSLNPRKNKFRGGDVGLFVTQVHKNLSMINLVSEVSEKA